MGGYTVGVAGQTVNLLSSDSGGSTPSPPTQDADGQGVEICFSRQITRRNAWNKTAGNNYIVGLISSLPFK